MIAELPMIFFVALPFHPFRDRWIDGVKFANSTIDFQVHNSLFLVAHFHNVIIFCMLYGLLAGYYNWLPKVFGSRLDGRWGRISALLWIFGFVISTTCRGMALVWYVWWHSTLSILGIVVVICN